MRADGADRLARGALLIARTSARSPYTLRARGRIPHGSRTARACAHPLLSLGRFSMSITTRTLACGMPLICESMSGVRSVGITWLLPVGTSSDPADREGLTTMLSELVMRGAGELDSREQADAFDVLGASRSADAATHHARLGFTLLGDRLQATLPLMVDMVLRPRFDEDSIEPSRDLALQALESLKDDPQERAVLTVRSRHNPVPFNRSGLGTPEGLSAITRDDLVAQWSTRALPTSEPGAPASVLAIAGDLESAGGPDGIAMTLDRLLAGWGGSAKAIDSTPSSTRGTYHHITDASAQVQVVLMHDAPPEPDPKSRPERIVAHVLSGGMAARLFTEVREKRGLCYSVSASYAADREAGRCLAYVGTTPERAQESLTVLMSELERINSPAGVVTDSEFQRAMIGIRSNLVLSGESTSARASALASDYHRLGRARTLQEIIAQYAVLRLDDVNAHLSRRSLGPVTIVTLGPSALVPPASTRA